MSVVGSFEQPPKLARGRYASEPRRCGATFRQRLTAGRRSFAGPSVLGTLRCLGGVIIASLGASQAMAQSQPMMMGVVRDAQSARPLIGAHVSLRSQTSERSTRTDELGQFAFASLPVATYALTVRLIGYVPEVRTIEVSGGTESLAVALTRVTALDTVRVRAFRQGIYGVVGRSRDLQPLARATVQVIGASGRRVTADSSGRFFLPLQTPGAYFVRATAPSYEGTSVSVTIPRDESVNVVLLLDTATSSSHRLEYAFADFRERIIRRRPGSALITRSELLRNGNTDLLTAITRSPSFAKKGLRFGRFACVFADGRALVGTSVQSFDAEGVEAVEVYGIGQDASGTLKWPRAAPCGETGLVTPGRPRSDVVARVSIWLKR